MSASIERPGGSVRRRPPWFGHLLDWQWDPQTERHATWHDGRSHSIVKVNRQTANAHGGGMAPGWHIWSPNPREWDGFGPGVGRTMAVAKRTAEAWIVCPYMDMMGYPKLNLAMYSTGVHYEGLAIVRDDANQRFTVRRDGRDPVLLGVIRPVFLGRGGGVRIRWRACGPAEELLSGHATWAEAVRALRKEVQ